MTTAGSKDKGLEGQRGELTTMSGVELTRMLKVSVGARIRDQREARKMSQAELAKLVGLSSAAIWNWETKGRVPRRQVLAKVAEALNVSEQYLAEGRNGVEFLHPEKAPATRPAKTHMIQPASAKTPTAQYPAQSATVAEELNQTRMRIAKLTGFDPDQIVLTLTVSH
jgi:transcriptional regulator with XRE-family HTH domain